jgi:microcystin-dependent protein
MATPQFIGSVNIFGFTFAPRGFAFCNGQQMSISQNTALFALITTLYGGDGHTTFALPDLRGRAPIHFGAGGGLATYEQGQVGGRETVTLTTPQMPAHTHDFANNGSALTAIQTKGTTQAPAAGSLLARGVDGSASQTQPQIYVPAGTAGTIVALGGLNVAGTIAASGGGQAVPILSPFLVLNYCIALQGIFPSRN